VTPEHQTVAAPTKDSLIVKGTISGALVVLIIVQLWTRFELGSETVALVVLAVLPWLSTIVESIELPGGGKLLFREFRAKIAAQEEQLRAQQRIINELVLYSMSFLIFQRLSGIHRAARQGGEYLFQGDLEAFRRDLRFLRDHGYLHHFHVNELQDGQNLASSLRLTPAGTFYVEFREEFERQQREEMVKKLTSQERARGAGGR
jgi:hypothetical protein